METPDSPNKLSKQSMNAEIIVHAKQAIQFMRGPIFWTLSLMTVLSCLLTSVMFVLKHYVEGVPSPAITGVRLTISALDMIFNITMMACFRPLGQSWQMGRRSVDSFSQLSASIGPIIKRIFVISLLVQLICLVGLVALVVPGIALYVLLSPSVYLAATRDFGVRRALSTSTKIARQYWPQILAMAGVMTLVLISIMGGSVAFVVLVEVGLEAQKAAPKLLTAWTELGGDIVINFAILLCALALITVKASVFQTITKAYFDEHSDKQPL